MGELNATDALILFTDDSRTYVEHYDIVNGELKNGKPADEMTMTFLKQSSGIGIKPQILNYRFHFISDYALAFSIPAKKRLLSLHKDKEIIQGYLNIPQLLFVADTVANAVYVVMLIKDDIYKAPFSNIDNRKICFGSLEMTNMLTGSYDNIADNIVNAFFSTNFSNHYNSDIFDKIVKAIQTKQKTYEYEKIKIGSLRNYIRSLKH